MKKNILLTFFILFYSSNVSAVPVTVVVKKVKKVLSNLEEVNSGWWENSYELERKTAGELSDFVLSRRLTRKLPDLESFLNFSRTLDSAVLNLKKLKLTNLRKLETDGDRHFLIQLAEVQGKKVFVKYVLDKELRVHQAKMGLLLNKLGLGPNLLGVSEFKKDGVSYKGLVFGFYEGVSLKKFFFQEHSKFALVDGRCINGKRYIQPSHIIEILTTRDILLNFGFVETPDLDFILTPDGKSILIDPEYYSFLGHESPAMRGIPANPSTQISSVFEGLYLKPFFFRSIYRWCKIENYGWGVKNESFC